MAAAGQEQGAERRALALLQIREGEEGLVGWLFLHAFFGGVPLTLTTAASSALFLEHHGAALLPWAYLCSAAVVPAVGWLCLRVEARASFDRFLFLVVALIAGGELASRAGLALLGPARGTWALPVWTELEYSLMNLQLWSLAGRLLNVQQAKRLFGVVGSGALLSGGCAGLLVPVFVRFFGTENLLLGSAAASLASLLVLRRLSIRERDRLVEHAAPEAPGPKPDPKRDERGGAGSGAEAARELKPYLRAMYALMALAFVAYYLIERIFYDRAEARMPDTNALASFLGIFLGVSGFVSLVFRAWLSSKILARWGLVVGLLAYPVVVAVGAGSATVMGIALGANAGAVFWAIAMTRGAGGVLRESLDLQAALMLYQPLPKADRVAVQGMAEGIVGPLAGGFAGASLIVLERLGVDVVRLAAILACVAVCWVLIASYLRNAYKRVLEQALAARRLGRDELVLGHADRAPLLRALESSYPAEVLYALDMLHEVDVSTARSDASATRQSALFKRLLGHASWDVRREVLRRIERAHVTELLDDVARVAESDPDERVRGRAHRVLAAVADDDEAERVWYAVGSSDARLRREVMTGCLASGSIDRIALAWAELRRLAESLDPAQRILAAQVLRKLGTATFHRPLLKLLDDGDRSVRRAALVACKTVRHPRLLPLVVRALRSRALRAPAAATLTAIGEGALLPLRELVHEENDWRVRVRVLRIAARVRGRLAERLALDLLDTPFEEVRQAALLALVACGYRPAKPARPLFERLLESEITEATWTLGAIQDLETRASRLSLNGGSGSDPSLAPSQPGGDGLSLIRRALRRELSGSRERILLLLSFLYDPTPIHAARSSYASPSNDRRAIALELLESALPVSVRSLVFPLFDDIAPKHALAKLPEEVIDEDAERQGKRGRLLDLLDPQRSNVTSWTRACALWTLRDPDAARALMVHPDEDIRETARAVAADVDRRARSREENGEPMLNVEKVLILRAVPMFERTPDHILAELAAILREVDLPPNAELIKEGDLGDCMFVIVHGAVKVHREGEELAILGPRDIVGEMSVLDPEPRSASCTTTKATRLLRIDREDFFDMMADRIEIAQGILGVLCQRLRGEASRSHSLLPPISIAG